MHKKIKMKRYTYIIIFTLLGTAGCSKVLDLVPESQVTTANFFVSENDFKIYANQFYDFFPRDGRGFGNFLWKVDNNSDNQLQNNNGNIFAFGVNTVADNPPDYDGGGWNFDNIREVNFFLDRLEENNVLSDQQKNRWRAEGRFFRAYLYYDKLRKYGDVPWYGKSLNELDADVYKPRDPRGTVVNNILTDLDFAVENLPQTIGNKENIDKFVALALKARIALFEGTFRKYHALPEPYDNLLQQAADAALNIMEQPGYSLHKTGGVHESYYNYFAMAKPGSSSETILARHFSTALGITHWSQRFIVGQPETGFSKSLADDYLCTDGLPVSLSPLFDKNTDYDFIQTEMANRDPRMTQSIWNKGDLLFTNPDEYFNEALGRVPPLNINFPTGYSIKKFSKRERSLQVPDAADDGYPLFRLGEVYLIYAEAKAELGTLLQGDLDKSINILRDRVGMPHMELANLQADPDSDFNGSIPEVPAVSTLIDEIRRERRVELAAEGLRRDDLMRWKAGQLLAKNPLGAKFNPAVYPEAVGQPFARTNSEGFLEPYQGLTVNRQFNEQKNYFYPIPPSQIGLYKNDVLTQNPNWQ